MEKETRMPKQILFPESASVINAVLETLELPTGFQQNAYKMNASYKGTMAFLTGNKEGFKAASFESSLYSDINIFRDFKILCQTEEERVKKGLSAVIQKHDEFLKQFSEKYPLFADKIWQVFRRTGYVNSVNARYAFYVDHQEELKKAKERDLRCVIIHTTDEEFANFYIPYHREHLPRDIEEQLLKEPEYRLIEFDKDYLCGIGRYAFANSEGDIFQTLWDVRQKEIQFFSSPKKSD